MPRPPKADREAEKEAYRIFMPLLFWLLAYFLYHTLHGLAVLETPAGRIAWAGIIVLVIAGLCQIPRAVRTIRNL